MKGTHAFALAGVVLLVALAGCSSSPDKPAAGSGATLLDTPFTATGNEPFWRVIVEPGQLVLERPGEPTEELRYKTLEQSDTGHRFRASREGLVVELVTAPQLCRDSMTGMPHPLQARLFINGKPAAGCGGNPRDLIMGTEWVVETIGGQGLVAQSRATIEFLPDGQIAGLGSCNRYSGRWSLTGETLEVGPLASTRKACEPALMDQENRLLRQLQSTRSFDISQRGELLLSPKAGAALKAAPARQ